MPISAPASLASRRSARDAYEPRPGGTPVARTPALVHASLEVVADDAPLDLDLDLAQERLRHRTGSDDDRRMPGARPFECVADILEAVLEDAGEVGVARPRQRHPLLPLASARRLALRWPRAHAPRPVLVVAVADDERERRAERPAVAKARVDLDPVGLDLLAGTAPVPLLAPAEVLVDRRPVEHEPGRQPADDRDQRGAVRLAGGDELERHRAKPTAARITSTGAATPVQSSNEATPCATSTSRPPTTVAPASRAVLAVAVSGYGRSTRV